MKAVIETFVPTAAAIMLMPNIAYAITGEAAEDLEVRSTVIEFYSAVSLHDVAVLRRCTTPAFHVVMDGVDYDLEATIGSILEEAKHGQNTLKTSNIRVERNGRAATASVDVAATFQSSMGGNPIVSQLAANFALTRESSVGRRPSERRCERCARHGIPRPDRDYSGERHGAVALRADIAGWIYKHEGRDQS